jgi:hypothetical protein
VLYKLKLKAFEKLKNRIREISEGGYMLALI